MKKLIFLLFLFIGFSAMAQNTELFEEANEAYAAGKLSRRQLSYMSEILENGETSAALAIQPGKCPLQAQPDRSQHLSL